MRIPRARYTLAATSACGLRELLGDGLGRVVADALDLLVARLAQPLDEPLDLLGLEPQLDQGLEISAGRCIHGPVVPCRAFGLGHVAHEVGVRVLARVRSEVRPRGLERRVAAPQRDQQVTLQLGEIVLGERWGALLLQCDPAFDPRERICRLAGEPVASWPARDSPQVRARSPRTAPRRPRRFVARPESRAGSRPRVAGRYAGSRSCSPGWARSPCRRSARGCSARTPRVHRLSSTFTRSRSNW